MSELRQPREVDMVPDSLRYVPQVKSDIIIQRREVSMAPVEGMNIYQRDGTNTITFNVQGHKTTNQLMDSKSLYFTWHVKFKNGYPIEDVSNLIEEVIVSSNGRVLERIRHFQYIQYFLKQYEMSRRAKARLGKREGFNRYEDDTIQLHTKPAGRQQCMDAAAGGNPVAATFAPNTADHGFSNSIEFSDGPLDINTVDHTRMSDNLGYYYEQRNRSFTQSGAAAADVQGRVENTGYPAAGTGTNGNETSTFGFKLMKFRIKASGLLSCEKMLPIGFCPLTVQFRLSDKLRCTDKAVAGFDYVIKRPRMHFSVCTCGQAYASALQQRLRGPGITLNMKLYDTFFQIINSDKQIVIPSNKQRLSKVYLMLHDEDAAVNATKNAFRSSVTGTNAVRYGLIDDQGNNDADRCLQSYQFQVGTEVSEPVSLENTSKSLAGVFAQQGVNADRAPLDNPNTGMAYLEAYLKSIGAVNGHEQDVEYWGRELDSRCKLHEGGDLLATFLHRYFCCVYDGEKFLGTEIESGVDTEAGKDIVCDLRWSQAPRNNVRAMALICYHAQMIIKENSVEMSY